MTASNRLQAQDVLDLARRQWRDTCAACAPFASPGWDSFPGTVSDEALRLLGALWLPGDEEPTLEEHRPPGVDQWSAEAPIALHFHPCNRCQVWACKACGKPFLRYTEYGGYYEDRRIRELDPGRVDLREPEV